jgi:hypothetical protein
LILNPFWEAIVDQLDDVGDGLDNISSWLGKMDTRLHAIEDRLG